MHRRDFIKLMASASGAAVLSSCGDSRREGAGHAERRLLVLAFDGLDPRITQQLLQAGKLPNLARLAATGSFKPLGTSTPPHTPIAFASMISGADPGLHNLFDFIHRDPNPPQRGLAIRPHFSTSKVVPPENDWLPDAIPLGQWRFPLGGSTTCLLRRGPAFWDYLVREGVDTELYYLPANYPTQRPQGSGRFRSISGMGTPDLLGGYGEFTLFSTDHPKAGQRVAGGQFVHLSMSEHRATAELIGPPNFLRNPDESGRVAPLRVPLGIVRDPTSKVAKIEISGSIVLLSEGEWSDWIPIELPTGVPGSSLLSAAQAPTSLYGMVRLYLKQVHRELELYVSPINIDPMNPVNPIASPNDFSRSLAERHGRFYTIGIPEDTKALSHGALDEDEFLAQCDLATAERIEQYRDALKSFKRGCLFFYFGATDLLQHMFWRDRDPEHPGHDKEQAQRYGQVVEELYVGCDRLVGEALQVIGPDDVLMVLSDHGFTTFRRGFNLNRWLLENGYLRMIDRRRRGELLLGTGDRLAHASDVDIGDAYAEREVALGDFQALVERFLRLVQMFRVRGDLTLGKIAEHVAKHPLLLSEVKIHTSLSCVSGIGESGNRGIRESGNQGIGRLATGD